MIRAAALTLIASLAAFPAAGDFSLSLPLDCTPGQDCHIQNYVDRDPGTGARDFTCGPLTYDGHKGTDFALTTEADIARNVAVRAPAMGRVLRVRDGMADARHGAEGSPDIEGRECGNGLVIAHGDGWQTQYCHLKRGSLAVRPGDIVRRGDTLGAVGMSGKAEFPHLHISLRRNGTVIDPYAPDPDAACGSPQATIWDTPPVYTGGGVTRIGFATQAPELTDLRSGWPDVDSLSADAPALVVWALGFGARTGDSFRISLLGPDGEPLLDHEAEVPRDRAIFSRFAGLRARAPWPPGHYRARVVLVRNGTVLSDETATLISR